MVELRIETCDEACAGCAVVLESDGKVNRPSRNADAKERAAVDQLFRDYLQSDSCRSDPQHLEVADIGSGNDASSVKMVVDGSFTAPRMKQTVLTFFAGHCGVLGAHAEGWGTTFSLLLENGRLIATGTAGPTRAVELWAVDVDVDGVNELVERTADYGSGTTFSGATVWSYLDGPPHALATFDLSIDSCNFPDGERYESTLLVRWDELRRSLCLSQKRREMQCPVRP